MTDQLRPLEAEAAVVGSILIDPACLPAVEEIIRPEDLALEIHRAIYQAALALRRAGRQIDPVLIRTEAARMGAELDGAYLLELMDRTPTAANVKEYAKITRTEARRRELGAMLQRAQTAAAKEEPEEVMATLAREAAELQQEGTTDELIRPEEALLAFYAHRDAVDQGGSRAVVSTGYLDLDSALGGGMVANGLYILAARPGMGKTTLALNIADRVAERVGPVLFVSLEMDVEQLVAKRVSLLSGVASNRVLMRQLSPEEYRKVSAAADKLAKIPVAVNRRAFVTVEQIEALARRVPGLSMVVVDYLGLITPPGWSQKNGRVEATTAISNGLKQTAKALKVPFLVLSQLNRQVESRPDKHPILSDLRDTGAVEQDADGVMFLHRPAQSGWGGGPAPTAVLLEKNRHGPTGRCELAFALGTCKVSAISGSAPPPGQWNPADGEDPFPDPCPQEAIKL